MFSSTFVSPPEKNDYTWENYNFKLNEIEFPKLSQKEELREYCFSGFSFTKSWNELLFL